MVFAPTLDFPRKARLSLGFAGKREVGADPLFYREIHRFSIGIHRFPIGIHTSKPQEIQPLAYNLQALETL